MIALVSSTDLSAQRYRASHSFLTHASLVRRYSQVRQRAFYPDAWNRAVRSRMCDGNGDCVKAWMGNHDALSAAGDFVAAINSPRTLNRYSRRGHENYSLYSIFLGVYATGSYPQQKSLSWREVAWIVSISERKDHAVTRGNYTRYGEGRSALCVIVALWHEEKVYPVPSNAGHYKGRGKEERVLEGPR